MKRYRFRLEQVLHVRRVQADLAAAALGAAQRAEADALAAESARWRAVTERPRLSGAAPVERLLADRAVWDAELDDLRRVAAARAEAEQATAARRDAWRDAARRVRALELLDERRREEHRVGVDRSEAHRVDDLVAARHGARR